VWRSHCQEAKIGETGGHRIPRNGQPWMSAVTLSHGRNGLSARRMAVLSTLRALSLCRQVHRELMRSALLDVTSIIPATACNQRNYVERYSRYSLTQFGYGVLQIPSPIKC
jgi:hypothetical protein